MKPKSRRLKLSQDTCQGLKNYVSNDLAQTQSLGLKPWTKKRDVILTRTWKEEVDDQILTVYDIALEIYDALDRDGRSKNGLSYASEDFEEALL